MSLGDTVVLLGLQWGLGVPVFGFRRRRERVRGGPDRSDHACAGCGYSLEGLDERARCPECGRDDARLRFRQERVAVRWSPCVRTLLAGTALGSAVVASCVMRMELIRGAAERVYGFPLLDRFFREDFNWGYLLMLLVWPLALVIGRAHRAPLVGSLLCSAALFGAVCVQTWSAGVFTPGAELKFWANVSGLLGVCAALVLSVLIAEGAARRRMPHQTEASETPPCASSSPTTTASTRPASGPCTRRSRRATPPRATRSAGRSAGPRPRSSPWPR
ncbi:MAG: hypothetical protein ACF8Q5_10655 [Phycisphaerales bacterium JB040]